ncbi:MAG: hypothetical protein ACRDY2_10475 [Acidimicrobiales bacterium]
MKFKTGFLAGAAVGVWAANKAGQLQRLGIGMKSGGQKGSKGSQRTSSATADQAAEKVKALGDLAKERLSGLIEGPLGEVARERVADLIHSSLSGGASSRSGEDPIDTKARWPR